MNNTTVKQHSDILIGILKTHGIDNSEIEYRGCELQIAGTHLQRIWVLLATVITILLTRLKRLNSFLNWEL